MKKIIITISIITTIFVSTNIVFAAGGISTGGTAPVQLTNPLTSKATNETPQELIGKIINAVMGIVGSLALAMFIYGGFTWMIAAGNDQNVKKGKDILTWATLGLIVIFSSYALVKFIFSGLGVT